MSKVLLTNVLRGMVKKAFNTSILQEIVKF